MFVVSVAATEFTEGAPGWLRASAIVTLLLGGVGLGRAWTEFHWKAVLLERRIKTSLNESQESAYTKKNRGVDQKATSDLSDEDHNKGVVEPWPKSYETWWTSALYLLVLDVALLVALVIWICDISLDEHQYVDASQT
ncbi:MAG: hypothetical protein GEU79_03280 [Acidimicrobiia bacterium]|nr:hypothetical protein [Acidimicrobiia bacterium]